MDDQEAAASGHIFQISIRRVCLVVKDSAGAAGLEVRLSQLQQTGLCTFSCIPLTCFSVRDSGWKKEQMLRVAKFIRFMHLPVCWKTGKDWRSRHNLENSSSVNRASMSYVAMSNVRSGT